MITYLGKSFWIDCPPEISFWCSRILNSNVSVISDPMNDSGLAEYLRHSRIEASVIFLKSEYFCLNLSSEFKSTLVSSCK